MSHVLRPAGVAFLDAIRQEPQLALGLARVSPEPNYHAALAATWLCGAEHARAARFAVAHARADYLAGRIAAKHAAQVLAPAEPPTLPSHWEIRAGTFEQPRLDHRFPGSGVTLAHAGGVGLALVHPLAIRCGIDLEPLDRDADDVISTQVSAAEVSWAREPADREQQRARWLLLWTAREALGKSHGTGLLEPERLCATTGWTLTSAGWRARLVADAKGQVCAVIAGGFVVSMVLPASLDGGPLMRFLADALSRSTG